LRGLKQENFFLALFPWRSKRRNGSPRSWHAEGQDCSWGELNLVSDFLQEIVVRDAPSSIWLHAIAAFQ
jgi:hypothetical protein